MTVMPKLKALGVPTPTSPEALEWQARGICAISPDPDIWFSESYRDRKQARAACLNYCPVREQCFQYAMDNREPCGVWGGHTFKSGRPVRDGLRPHRAPARPPTPREAA